MIDVFASFERLIRHKVSMPGSKYEPEKIIKYYWKILTFSILCSGSAAWAQPQSDWRYVTDANLGEAQKRYLVQVDKSSMRLTKNGVLYWLRIVEATDTDKIQPESGPWDAYRKAVKGPSLYEDDCTSHRLRVVQGPIIWGYDFIPLNRPANWQFIVPDSLAQITHRYVCRK